MLKAYNLQITIAAMTIIVLNAYLLKYKSFFFVIFFRFSKNTNDFRVYNRYLRLLAERGGGGGVLSI